MNELVVKTFDGEIYTPDDTVRVIGRSKPFKAGIIDRSFPSGLTVAELLDRAIGDEWTSFAEDYYVCIDGTPVPREWRARVRVKGGCVVTFSPRLQKGVVRNIALIAVAVLALIIVPFLTPMIGATLASVIGAGVVLGATLAVNALFPIAPPATTALAAERSGTSNVYRITGSRNNADPFGPVPVIFGRVRVWPRFGALPYTEFVGQTQYLRMLFVVGYGPMFIDDFRIGQTPLTDFSNVQYEVRYGWPADTPITLYPGTVFQDALTIELTVAAGWEERTTAEDIDEILVDISAPGGLYRIDPQDGKFKNIDLGISVEYRAVGSGTWLFLGGFDSEFKKKEAWRFGFRLAVARGQYEVRVWRWNDDDGDGTIVQDVYWTGLTGLRHDPPIDFHKGLTLVAIRIQATGQLNNVIDTFNCMAQALPAQSWNGSIWDIYQLTRNPADMFRYALQGPAIHEPVVDDQIDIESLQDWHDYCAAEGWEYNFEHDRRLPVLETLRMIAAAGRARVVRTDGKWGVIWDEANIPVAQHFTPRNSWGFEENRVYFDPPHAFRINFINEEIDYQPDERKVYADGYSAANATKFEALEFPGVTNPVAIYRLGRFQLAQALLRPATYTLMTNWQALSCTIGSRVYCAHDVTLWGLVQARVLEVSGDVITLDDEVTFELGTEYQIRFRQADGTSVLRSVMPPETIGNTRTITLTADIVPSPAEGDLVMFGEDITGPAVLLRVLEIEWLPDLRARVTLVDDAPEISDADTGAIPPFDSQITPPANLYIRAPSGVTVRELIYVQDGAAYADAVVSWQALLSFVTGFEVQMRDDNVPEPEWDTEARLPASVQTATIHDLQEGTYSFRVRSLFWNGGFSEWATVNNISFTGVLSRPDDVTNFRISVLGDVANLSWDPILGQAVAYYVVRHSPATSGAAWGSASVLFERLTSNAVQTAALNGTYLVKAFTLADTESANPALIIFTGQAIISLNVVETLIGHTDWFGLLTDLTVNVDDRLHLDADDVEGEFLFYKAVELGASYTSRVSSTIYAFGDDPANVMESWATLLEVDNLSGAEASDWRVRLDERHIESAIPIDTSLGTNIGTMTANGGLAAAFDLDTTQAASASAIIASATSAYVGKTLAAPAPISHVLVWASSDAGFFFTGTGGAIELYGKNGSAPAHGADGTLLGSQTDITDKNETHAILVVSDDPTTAWDHVWVRLTQPSAGPMRVAELEIWEADPAFAWTDWSELRLSDITAQAYEFRLTLTSLNPAIDVLVEELTISVDMPDRVEALGDLVIPNTGTTISFDVPFRHLETVVVTAIQDAGSGDYAVISNRNEESFDIIVKNSANVGVNRTVDAVAAGYGRRIV